MRESVKNLVSAATEAKRNDDAMITLGYAETPFFSIYGKIVDAIFHLVGEYTGKDFDTSFTYAVMNTPELSEEERTDLLLGKIYENHSP